MLHMKGKNFDYDNILFVKLFYRVVNLNTRGSHIRIACRSVCDRDQNGIKRSRSFSEAIKGSRSFSETIKGSRWSQSYSINDQILFLTNIH